MRKLVVSGILAIILLSSSFSSALAITHKVELSEYAIIQNNMGEFRVLFNFILPEGFDSFDIEMVKLVIPFGPISKEVEVHLFPVTTEWASENVGWGIPWTMPGGDYDDTLSVNIYMLKSGNVGTKEAIFIVTDVFLLIQHNVDYNGFILMPPPYEKVGFEEHMLSYFEKVKGIKLVINTR